MKKSEKIIAYRIIHQSNLIIEIFRGTISFEDIISNKNKILNDKEYNHNYTAILDFRNVQIGYDNEGFQKIVDFLKNTSILHKKKRAAYLVNNAVGSAFTTIFENKIQGIMFYPRAFSTPEAAIDWLGIKDFSVCDFENIVEYLSLNNTSTM